MSDNDPICYARRYVPRVERRNFSGKCMRRTKRHGRMTAVRISAITSAANEDDMTNNQADAQDKAVLAQLQAKIAELEAKNKALEAEHSKPRTITFKVSDKGGLSVYGINSRFPVTLYIGQWERLLEALPRMRQFMADNAAKFARKETTPAAA